MAQQAKRKISKFNFEADNSAVALVSESQGGGANGFKTLLIKSAGKFSKEFIEKAQKVQVTLTFEDFLSKFMGVYGRDAQVLTHLLGMDTDEDELGVYKDEYFYDWFDNKLETEGGRYRSPTEEDQKEWLEYRTQGITLIKSLAESDNKLELIASLSEPEYWSVINEQKFFEKALEKESSGGTPTTPESQTGTITKATSAVHNNEDITMSGKTPETKVEDAVALQKALDDQAVALQKAMEQLEAFKQKEVEAIAKAREAVIVGLVGTDQSATLLKSLDGLDAEKFDAVVEVIKSLGKTNEKDPMFAEVGSKENGVEVAKSANSTDDAVAEKFRNKYNKA